MYHESCRQRLVNSYNLCLGRLLQGAGDIHRTRQSQVHPLDTTSCSFGALRPARQAINGRQTRHILRSQSHRSQHCHSVSPEEQPSGQFSTHLHSGQLK